MQTQTDAPNSASVDVVIRGDRVCVRVLFYVMQSAVSFLFLFFLRLRRVFILLNRRLPDRNRQMQILNYEHENPYANKTNVRPIACTLCVSPVARNNKIKRCRSWNVFCCLIWLVPSSFGWVLMRIKEKEFRRLSKGRTLTTTATCEQPAMNVKEEEEREISKRTRISTCALK